MDRLKNWQTDEQIDVSHCRFFSNNIDYYFFNILAEKQKILAILVKKKFWNFCNVL